jgi:hypothetical protein
LVGIRGGNPLIDLLALKKLVDMIGERRMLRRRKRGGGGGKGEKKKEETQTVRASSRQASIAT